MLIRKDEATAEDFKAVCKFMSKHNVVSAHLMDSTGESYLAGLYLMKINDTISQGNTESIPQKAKIKDTDKLAAYYRFTTTELDMEATTFKEASSKQNYAKDECFLNTLYDFFLPRQPFEGWRQAKPHHTRKHLKDNRYNRAKQKNGLSIEDVLPVFVKHRLVLRVFDKVCKEIFKHEPQDRSHHNKAMYCMMSDGHIYTEPRH